MRNINGLVTLISCRLLSNYSVFIYFFGNRNFTNREMNEQTKKRHNTQASDPQQHKYQ